MEELAKIHIRHFRTALFSAVIIAGITAQAFLGPYLYLGYPDVRGVQFSLFVFVALTAVAAGVCGSLMCKIILRITHWKRNFSTLKTVVFILFSGLVVATTAYFINTAILGSGKALMNQALFTNEKAIGFDTVLMRIAGPIICFNTGAAGGVFAPSLAAGASVGAMVADLCDITGSNANLLILCGMVGFSTGVTRTPFTSAILVLEMTDRHSVIFYLLLAALVSNIAALLVDKHSFYEQLKKNYVAVASEEK
jgi:H+/Cl- antiporter ClcA